MQPKPPFQLVALQNVPPKEALQELLAEYWGVILPKLQALGGPDFQVSDLVDDSLANLTPYLPPHGCIFLAYAPDRSLLGCGFLHKIAPDVGEMKRLFVRPEAQGTGLGRALVEARIKAAKEMGLRWLYADTLKGNTPMLRLYDRLGFQEIDRYPGHENYEAVLPHIVYRGLKL